MSGETHSPTPQDSKCNGSKQHIMVFPYPAQGHLLPLLDLTHQLCLHGDITVSIIVTPKNLPYLSPLLTAHPSAVSAVTFLFPENPSLPPGVENVKDTGASGNPLIMASLRQLREPIINWISSHPNPPVAIISDFFLGWTNDLGKMGISRDHWHKRRATGGKRKPLRKKRKFELGRPAANTKLGARRIHTVRTRGGNKKFRALRLDQGNFSWGSECCTRKTRLIDVVYNASNNELVRTKTLVKNAIVVIDATPFRQWYEAHYAIPIGRKKGAKLTDADEALLNKKRSKKVENKYKNRQRVAKVEPALEEQFQTTRLLACVSSRPGQCGRADGYILEGKELEFYMRKIKAKKGK